MNPCPEITVVLAFGHAHHLLRIGCRHLLDVLLLTFKDASRPAHAGETEGDKCWGSGWRTTAEQYQAPNNSTADRRNADENRHR